MFVNAGVPVGDVRTLRLRLLRQSRRPQRRQLPQSANAAANRDYLGAAPNQTPNDANFVALTPDGFLPLIDTDLKDWPGRSASAASLPAGRPTCRSATAITVRSTRSATASTPRSGPPARARSTPAGWISANGSPTSISRSEFAVGLAGAAVDRASALEYRHENFKITPGELQSYAGGPLFRASIRHHCRQLRRPQGGVFAGGSVCSFPGRRRRGRAGLPRHPAGQRDRRRPPQLCRPMSSSTPSCSKISPPPSPGATSIFPISATR